MKLGDLKRKWNALMAEVSAGVTDKTPVADLAATFAFVREIEKTLDSKDKSSVTAIVKTALVDAIKINGSPTDGVSTVATFGGWRLMMHPTRRGIDPKKMEALLVAKKKNVAQFMKPVVSYIVDEALVTKAIKMKVFSTEEIASMQYEESWTLKTPTYEEE